MGWGWLAKFINKSLYWYSCVDHVSICRKEDGWAQTCSVNQKVIALYYCADQVIALYSCADHVSIYRKEDGLGQTRSVHQKSPCLGTLVQTMSQYIEKRMGYGRHAQFIKKVIVLVLLCRPCLYIYGTLLWNRGSTDLQILEMGLRYGTESTDLPDSLFSYMWFITGSQWNKTGIWCLATFSKLENQQNLFSNSKELNHQECQIRTTVLPSLLVFWYTNF